MSTGSDKTGSLTSPPEAWGPMFRLARLSARPLERFMRVESASGIVLLAAAAVALFWANSPWSPSYSRLWQTTLGLRIGGFVFERSLLWFVNDVLMAVFFFVVGLEIRREIREGALSEWRRAMLPVTAALGGMVFPAIFYLMLIGEGAARSGWGIPMATDIAFAVGVLTLLGRRVPAALRILLLALAVIDDVGAIIVIAVFYSPGVETIGLIVAASGVAVIVAFQAMGLRRVSVYLIPGVAVWAGVYQAGVHPAIAGVLVGLLTPARAWLGADGFVGEMHAQAERAAERLSGTATESQGLRDVLRKVDFARREALSPVESLIDSLHPWVAFVIMPVFALANAGVALTGISAGRETLSVSAAIAFGLVVGKPIGVFSLCFLLLRLRIVRLPPGLTLRHLVVLGTVAGIGFTMSLFVVQLAFRDPVLLAAGKLGVLGASAVAIVVSLALGRASLKLSRSSMGDAGESVDEVETRKRP